MCREVTTLTVLVLPVVMLVISPPRREQRRLALVPLQPLQTALASLAVAAVCGGHRPDGVLDFPHFCLPVDCLSLGLPGSAGHGAGLRGEVDWCRLVSPVHPGAPRPAVASLQTDHRVLLSRLALLAEGQQLLDGLRARGSCQQNNELGKPSVIELHTEPLHLRSKYLTRTL